MAKQPSDTYRSVIVDLVKEGTFPSVAARSVGITFRTFRRWMERGDEDESAGRKTVYARFFREVDAAHAEAEVRALRRMRAAKDKDVQFRKESWWLERWNKEWAPARRVEVEVRNELAQQLLAIVRQQLEPAIVEQVEHAILVAGGEGEPTSTD